MARVLIVDDSALMRREMKEVFEAEGYDLSFARNGQEAIDIALQDNPDVIILDINMPVMDGLTCLAHLMQKTTIPVLMFSSLTEKGTLATFEALELGALDYIAKPGGTISADLAAVREELKYKVRTALRARRRGMREPVRLQNSVKSVPLSQSVIKRPKSAMTKLSTGKLKELVLIGASTGGPSTLETIFRQIPSGFQTPIVVVQHMPEKFTKAFAERLNRVCAVTVVEVERLMPVQKGHIYIAQGGADTLFAQRGGELMVMSRPMDNTYSWHPSVDRMVESALQVCDPTYILGILLTGMGDDGAKSMTQLHEKGGYTLAESEETAIIYGMPKELINRGGANEIQPFTRMTSRLIDLCL